jgi:hypothetical protein
MATRRMGTTAEERDPHTGQAHHKYVRAYVGPSGAHLPRRLLSWKRKTINRASKGDDG